MILTKLLKKIFFVHSIKTAEENIMFFENNDKSWSINTQIIDI